MRLHDLGCSQIAKFSSRAISLYAGCEGSPIACYVGDMRDAAQKHPVFLLRKERGLNQARMAEGMGISVNYYSELENKIKRWNDDLYNAAAKVLDVHPSVLMGAGGGKTVRVDAVLGANDYISLLPESVMEEVPPSGMDAEDCRGIVVGPSGASTVLAEGWIVFSRKELDGVVPVDCLGKWCLCGLADGRIAIKTVERGSREGFYHLMSRNPAITPMIDQQLRWATRIVAIKPA